MFSVRQKREISEAVQQILAETNHPELTPPSEGEIGFELKVFGRETWSWAEIKNNSAVEYPSVNPHNEAQDTQHSKQGGSAG